MRWKQRWSLVRMALGMRKFVQTGQWGDGREAAESIAGFLTGEARVAAE